MPLIDLLDLTGRAALVTGAGRGIGRQIALELARHGASVAVNDCDPLLADRVVAEIVEAGGPAAAFPADVRDYASVVAAVGSVEARYGSLDILVNNAGNAGPNPGLARSELFWESEPTDWVPWIETNLYGVLNCARACLPSMVGRRYGRMVTIISDAARVGDRRFVVYSAAKAGAAGFTRSLATHEALRYQTSRGAG